jgi:hypothetical protein
MSIKPSPERQARSALAALLIVASLTSLTTIAFGQQESLPSVPATGPDGKPIVPTDYPEARQTGVLPPIPKPPELPKTPLALRYRVDAPVRYLVRADSRVAVKGREDLKQLYRNSLVVSYRPIQAAMMPPAINWGGKAVAEVPRDGMRVLLEVEKTAGYFMRPELLAATERTHQVMRQAQMSYVLDARGKISDVVIHAPTHPLSRSSVEQTALMAELMQPVFPEQPIAPGATWTQTVVMRDGEGVAQMSQDLTNTFKLEEWRTCQDAACAYITIKQDVKSAGRIQHQQLETQGASVGGGEGWILFDPARGEVVKTYWKITSQGSVKALAGQGKDDMKELAQAEVLVEVELSSERIEPETR